MKNLFTKSKTSDYHQIRSQKLTIFYDNEKIEWMTSMINRNFSRIWFYHSTLQEKR